MIYISYRSNLFGKNINEENKPEYIIKTSKKGFNVEIDVWNINKLFFWSQQTSLKIEHFLSCE